MSCFLVLSKPINQRKLVSDHLICNVYGDCNGSGFLSSCAHYTSQFLERTYPSPHVTLSSNFLVWLPNHRYNHRLAPQTKQKSQIKVMRNKQVWAIIIFSGFQSLIFYTVMTWLPTMSIHAGLSSHEAGLLTSILSLISIPFQ